ncbi:hypothetical protein ACH5RR_003692 [Cinchona calisaya]|uniref:Uncharacterized protein n=1 Tax=Cinchona calisaya TaxID=153742 RepID=A0ABD3AVM2_9GENT
MWTLGDYEAGLWLLEHWISHDEVLCDLSFLSSYLVPVAFHPFEYDTMYLGFGKSILSYNTISKLSKLIVLRNPVTILCFPCVQSRLRKPLLKFNKIKCHLLNSNKIKCDTSKTFVIDL